MDRSTFVGGSEVAAVMGLSRWSSPLKVWSEKTGRVDPFEGNEATELGTELEDFVAKKFARKTGKKIRQDNRDFTHKDYPYMRAHIDRWIIGGEVLECKTCSAWKAKEWEGEEIPNEYLLQLNWYLGLVGHEKGHIAVLIGGQSFKYKELDFSQELFDRQVEVVKDFWENYVIPDKAPMAIATDKDTLVELFPESRPDSLRKVEGENTEFEYMINQLAIDRLEGKNQIKEISKDVDLAENSLKQYIGEDEGIETGQFKATWKTQKITRIDNDKLREDGLYDKYSRITTTRILRVTEKKGKL